MQTTAKLLEKLAIQSGEGKNGSWKKQDLLLEIGDQFKKKLCVTIWGDKVNIEELNIGDNLTIYLDLESRQYNDKWYSDIKAWKIEKNNGTTSPLETKKEISTEVAFENLSSNDDLPF